MIRVAVALAALGAVHIAHARDDEGRYANSPNREWFRGLRQPGTGIPCCDISDCRLVEARTSGDGWLAEIDGRWIEVPREKILQSKSSPTGSAIACYLGGADSILWFCFVLPPLA